MLLSCKVLGLKWGCGCKYPRLRIKTETWSGRHENCCLLFCVSHPKYKLHRAYIIWILDFHDQNKCLLLLLLFFSENLLPTPEGKKAFRFGGQWDSGFFSFHVRTWKLRRGELFHVWKTHQSVYFFFFFSKIPLYFSCIAEEYIPKWIGNCSFHTIPIFIHLLLHFYLQY